MDNELTVIDQREVELYGDMVTAIRADDGEIYVSLRQMCDVLGLSRQAQVRRIKRQEILAEGYKGGAVFSTPLSRRSWRWRATGWCAAG